MEDELPSCTASPSPTCGLPAAAVIAATQTPDMTSGPRLGHCSGRIACQDEALGWSSRLLSSISCPSGDVLAFCTRLHGYVSMSIARVFCPSSSIQLSIMTKCFDLGFGLSVPSVQCVPVSVTFAPVVSVNHGFSTRVDPSPTVHRPRFSRQQHSARGKCDAAESFPLAVLLLSLKRFLTSLQPLHHRNHQHPTRFDHFTFLLLLSLRLFLCSCDWSLCLRKRADPIAVDTSTSKNFRLSVE